MKLNSNKGYFMQKKQNVKAKLLFASLLLLETGLHASSSSPILDSLEMENRKSSIVEVVGLHQVPNGNGRIPRTSTLSNGRNMINIPTPPADGIEFYATGGSEEKEPNGSFLKGGKNYLKIGKVRFDFNPKTETWGYSQKNAPVYEYRTPYYREGSINDVEVSISYATFKKLKQSLYKDFNESNQSSTSLYATNIPFLSPEGTNDTDLLKISKMVMQLPYSEWVSSKTLSKHKARNYKRNWKDLSPFAYPYSSGKDIFTVIEQQNGNRNIDVSADRYFYRPTYNNRERTFTVRYDTVYGRQLNDGIKITRNRESLTGLGFQWQNGQETKQRNGSFWVQEKGAEVHTSFDIATAPSTTKSIGDAGILNFSLFLAARKWVNGRYNIGGSQSNSDFYLNTDLQLKVDTKNKRLLLGGGIDTKNVGYLLQKWSGSDSKITEDIPNKIRTTEYISGQMVYLTSSGGGYGATPADTKLNKFIKEGNAKTYGETIYNNDKTTGIRTNNEVILISASTKDKIVTKEKGIYLVPYVAPGIFKGTRIVHSEILTTNNKYIVFSLKGKRFINLQHIAKAVGDYSRLYAIAIATKTIKKEDMTNGSVISETVVNQLCVYNHNRVSDFFGFSVPGRGWVKNKSFPRSSCVNYDFYVVK